MPEEVFEAPQSTQPLEPKPTNWSKMVLAAVLGFGLLAGAAYAGYWYGTESANLKTQSAEPQLKTQIQPTPTPKPTPTPTPTPVIEDETEGWKIYVDDRYKYSIKYPRDWSIEPTPSGVGAVAQISKGESKIEISVSTRELQQGQSLEEWVRDGPSLYREEDITVLSQTSVVVGGLTGIKKISKLLDRGESLMIYIPRGNSVYFVSGGKDFLTTLEGTFNLMLSTFKFLE